MKDRPLTDSQKWLPMDAGQSVWQRAVRDILDRISPLDNHNLANQLRH